MIIIGVVALILLSKGTAKILPEIKSDEGIKLKACVSDAEGNCLLPSTQTQAIVTFEGQPSQIGVKYITIFSDITNIQSGNVPVEVTDISSPQTEYDHAIDTKINGDTNYRKQFTLNNGDTDSQKATFEVTDISLLGEHIYQLNVAANFKDALGNAVDVSKTGQVAVLIEADICTDNTPWGVCSTTKPQYCEPGQLNPPEYIPGTLIDKASVCGCPDGVLPDPNNPDKCLVTCVPNTCTSDPNSNLRYCDNGVLVEKCSQCDCKNDYYGKENKGCTTDDLCKYKIYTAQLDVSISS